MKTAISIPDDLFETAEMAAKRLGISRSQLYAEAVAAYVKEHGAEGVTEVLNEVYAGSDAGLDPSLVRMQAASIPRDDW